MAKYAVIISSNGPDNSGPLKYANDDANRLSETLKSIQCDFHVTNVVEEENPRLVEDIVYVTAQKCINEDTFLIYFSGHGYPEQGTLLLMLRDTSRDKPLTTALHAQSLVQAMRFCSASHKILILDCCHAGLVYADTRFKNNAIGTRVQPFVGSPEKGSESFVTLLASDRLESARELDELKGSFLTSALCDALGPFLSQADRDRDGAIDLDDLKFWLMERSRVHNRFNSHATVPEPYVFGRTRGRLFFTVELDAWQPYFVSGPHNHEFAVLPCMADNEHAWAIGTTPVTNEQYQRFVEATGYHVPMGEMFDRCAPNPSWRGPFEPWNDEHFKLAEFPVVCVTFADAHEFATWLGQANPDLSITIVPTWVWDFAAFGTVHPNFDPSSWQRTAMHHKSDGPIVVTDAPDRTNLFGVVDLFGNVWEWTGKEPETEEDLNRRPSIQHIGISTGEGESPPEAQVRGGSFLDDLERTQPFLDSRKLDHLRGRVGSGVETAHADLGFRVAMRIALSDLPSPISERIRARRQQSPRSEFASSISGLISRISQSR